MSKIIKMKLNTELANTLKEDLSKIKDDDISKLLFIWKLINTNKKDFINLEEQIKDKIRVFMKERQWLKHLDEETKINITINKCKREDINKKELLLILSPAQLAQVTKITTYEKMLIVTPEHRERLKKYVR